MADKAIADSKKALDSAVKFNGPVKKAPVSAEKTEPKVKTASSGLLGDQGADSAAGIKAKSENIDQYVKNVPKMHKGGEVKEDGLKNLKEGEVVIPKEKAEEGRKILSLKKKAGPMSSAVEEEKNEPKESKEKSEKSEGKKKTSDKNPPEKESKAKPHDFHRTETIHHKNGSHTTTHHPHPAKPSADGKPGVQAEPVSYASPDFASMQQGMEQNLGGGPAGGQASAAAPAAEAAPAAV